MPIWSKEQVEALIKSNGNNSKYRYIMKRLEEAGTDTIEIPYSVIENAIYPNGVEKRDNPHQVKDLD